MAIAGFSCGPRLNLLCQCREGHRSEYPPAKPEALRLLAPQRGLIAIVKSQNHAPSTISSTLQSSDTALPCPPAACIKPCILPELSKLLLPPRQSRGNSRLD